jgi:hypothetical protein
MSQEDKKEIFSSQILDDNFDITRIRLINDIAHAGIIAKDITNKNYSYVFLKLFLF